MDNITKRNLPIGVIDSGIGGLSVLKEAVRILPNEDFLYYGDSKNAPYGTKSTEEIRDLTFEMVDILVKKGIKALVVACNTATGACIDEIREAYPDMPVIGIEPAIKPAVVTNQGGRIIVLATSATVRQEKFRELLDTYKEEAEIVPLGCDGLMEFVEYGNFDQRILDGYLDTKLKPVLTDNTEAIVLGCTHYPFIRKQIKHYLDEYHKTASIQLIDGSKGTSSQLKRKLLMNDLFTDRITPGRITIMNSLEDEGIIELGWKLFNTAE